jgi:hypothetical protein
MEKVMPFPASSPALPLFDLQTDIAKNELISITPEEHC